MVNAALTLQKSVDLAINSFSRQFISSLILKTASHAGANGPLRRIYVVLLTNAWRGFVSPKILGGRDSASAERDAEVHRLFVDFCFGALISFEVVGGDLWTITGAGSAASDDRD